MLKYLDFLQELEAPDIFHVLLLLPSFRFESPDKARIQDKSSAYSGRSGKDAVD